MNLGFPADVGMNFVTRVVLGGRTKRQLALVHFGMKRTL